MLAEKTHASVTYLPLIDSLIEMSFHCQYTLIRGHLTGIDRYQSGFMGGACGDIIALVNSLGGSAQMKFQMTFFDCSNTHPVPTSYVISDNCHFYNRGVICMNMRHSTMSAVRCFNLCYSFSFF